jgi:hypothetical protein
VTSRRRRALLVSIPTAVAFYLVLDRFVLGLTGAGAR